jgi:competence protein ComEA
LEPFVMRQTLAKLALGLLLGVGLASPAWGQAAAKTKPSAATKPKARAAKVDLNTATAEELQELPGIGPSRAEAIIKARPFKSVADLKKVDDVPSRVYDEIAPRLAASAPPAVAARPSTKKAMPKPATPRAKAAVKEAEKEDDPAHQDRKKTALAPGRKINLNTATAEDLQELPGIGPVRSAAIVKGRPFASIEDVMKVDGIKEGIFGQIKDHITVK